MRYLNWSYHIGDLLPSGRVALTLFKGTVMLRSISSRLALLALAAGFMWSCDGERATQPQPSGKAAADGSAVVVVTVQQDGAPVSGVVVELSRSIAGMAASYEWSAETDENGQARIEVTAGNGYYQARVVQDGNEVGYRSSIPLNVGTEVPLNFALAALVADDDDALTMAYVQKAIDFYEANGLEATVAYYNNRESIEGDRAMLIIDPGQSIALAWGRWPTLVGTLDSGAAAALYSAYPTVEGQSAAIAIAKLIKDIAAAATAEGSWFEYQTRTFEGETEPSRNIVVLHDGLVFSAGHFGLLEKFAEAAQHYVGEAIVRYENEGLDATIAHYNNRDSMDEQFYLFLIGADDIYLAHPIFRHLIGTDIKDVVGSNGYELGREIARATEDGHWVNYLWPNPISNREEAKTTWAIRHDGLIFASGYYTAADDVEPPAWLNAEPRAYTMEYVEGAIDRYEQDGLDAMVTYYNSVSAFEGDWYLFVIDANDNYIVHPLLPHLIGTDIKDVVGANGYELGKEIAKATEDGHWIDYIWPHPVTLFNAPKSTYAIRRDGLIFASGYYPVAEDIAEQTMAFVQGAIDHYKEHGREAMVAYYSDEANSDGVRDLFLLDETGTFVAPSPGSLAGLDANRLPFPDFTGQPVGPQMANAPEEGRWLNFAWPGMFGSDNLISHTWVIRHDGLVFMTSYFDDKPSVLPAEPDDDA